MSRTRIAVAIVAGVGVAVAITIVVLAAVQDGQGNPRADSALGSASTIPSGAGVLEPFATADATVLAAHVPLTDSEAQESLRIASEDDNVRAILAAASNDATVESVIRLMHSDIRIGSEITYVLGAPVDIDMVVPWMDVDASDDASLKRGYGLAQMRQKVQGLTKFKVKVDLRAKRVAGIAPRKFTGFDESVAEIHPIQSEN